MEEIEKHVFQVKNGRKAKIILPDYKKITVLADELIPGCEKPLVELENKTKRTVQEIMEFLVRGLSKTVEFFACTFASDRSCPCK